MCGCQCSVPVCVGAESEEMRSQAGSSKYEYETGFVNEVSKGHHHYLGYIIQYDLQQGYSARLGRGPQVQNDCVEWAA